MATALTDGSANDASVAALTGANFKMRVCEPASVSSFSVSSSCHERRRRIGILSSAAAPYALH